MFEIIIILFSILLIVFIPLFILYFFSNYDWRFRRIQKGDFETKVEQDWRGFGKFLVFLSLIGFFGLQFNNVNFTTYPKWLLIALFLFGLLLMTVKNRKISFKNWYKNKVK
jgi:uncharacterized membrane protein YobD (UPF0266 family)